MMIAKIDWCRDDDLDELCEIEEASFDHPWPRRFIEYDLANQGPVAYMKASHKERTVGYAVLSRDEGASHLMNLAVRPESRRMGIASQLMLALEILSEEWGYSRMLLEVRPSNRAARDLYSGMGFSYHTRRHGFYSNGEDALVLSAKFPLHIIKRELE